MTALRSEDEGPRGFVPRAELYRALQRVEDLEAELAEMRDRLAEHMGQDLAVQLKTALPFLRPTGARLLAALCSSKNTVSFNCLIESGRIDGEHPSIALKTQVSYLKATLKLAGFPADGIENVWGSGYIMTEEGRQWVSNRVLGGIQT
jgi:hypothetical protein